jgi:hypothetical protein
MSSPGGYRMAKKLDGYSDHPGSRIGQHADAQLKRPEDKYEWSRSLLPLREYQTTNRAPKKRQTHERRCRRYCSQNTS